MKKFNIRDISFSKAVAVLPIVAMLCFTACETPLEFNDDDFEPYIVLMSKPTSDSTLAVKLSKSRFFLDTRPCETIEGASIEVGIGGSVYAPVSDSAGLYSFNAVPHDGDSVSVSVVVAGKRVSASTVMPRRGSYTLIWSEFSDADTTDTNELEVRFRITPADSKLHYYSVEFLQPYPHYDTDYTTISSCTYKEGYLKCNDPIVTNFNTLGAFLDDDDGDYYGSIMYFSNETFGNRSHDFTVTVGGFYYNSVRHCIEAGYSPMLRITELSQDLYLFDKTVDANKDGSSYFSEPNRSYTNITNGIGIFAGRTLSLLPLYEAAPASRRQ